MKNPGNFQSVAILCLLAATLACACTDRHTYNISDFHIKQHGLIRGRALSFAEILHNLDKLPQKELIAQLETLKAAPETSRQTQLYAAYLLGRAWQKTSEPENLTQAISLFDEAASIAPLAECCQWHIAECATTLGQEKTVRKALSQIEATGGCPESRAAAVYGLAQSYLRAGERERARDTFTQVRKQFPASNFALGAEYYLAEMSADNPETAGQALSAFRDYLRRSPDGHFAQNIIARLTSLKTYRPGPSDRELFAQVYFAHSQWQQALDAWAKSGRQDKHWWEQAMCLLQLQQIDKGKAALLSGIKSHPDDRRLPDAAAALCRRLNHNEAVFVWQLILSKTHKYADLALFNLALRAQPAQAIIYYKKLLYGHPRSAMAPEAAWQVFWQQVQQGKTAQLATQAGTRQKNYPDSVQAARFAFWQGKLFEREGQQNAAGQAYKTTARLYPATYYGWRAAGRLAVLGGGKDPGWVTNSGRAEPDPNWTWPDYGDLSGGITDRHGPLGAKSSGFAGSDTVAVLAELHQWQEALDHLPQAAGPIIKSFLLARVNLPVEAINTAAQALHGSPGRTAGWQEAFPLLYARTIQKACKKEKVDPLLVHALVREESRYNGQAVSSSRALGLMQLLPVTAGSVARQLGVRLAGQEDIFDPDKNLAMGTAYLAYVIKRHGGNALLGVASYNGGPNAAQGWAACMKQKGLSDWDFFVENIPFKQTRDYVRKVFGSYWNYQAIYM